MKISTQLAAGTGNVFDDAQFKKATATKFKAELAKHLRKN
jgi:hypothetical protein